MRQVYLDNAASTPMDDSVIEAMMEAAKEHYANPSSLHDLGRAAKEFIEECRRSIASALSVKPSEIIFGDGATLSNNQLISGVCTSYGGLPACTAIEHDSILNLVRSTGGQVLEVDSSTGKLDVRSIAGLADDIVVLSVMAVNNEFGLKQDITRVSATLEGVKQRRKDKGVDMPIYLHVDASQAGLYKLLPKELGIDLMTISGKSSYGPKKSSVMFVSGSVAVEPVLYGAGRERSINPGTQSISNIAGITKAITTLDRCRDAIFNQIESLSSRLAAGIREMGGQIIAEHMDRSPNIVGAIFPGKDNETLLYELNNLGIYVGISSACHASAGAESTALKAIGHNQEDQKSSLRISLSKHTSEEDIDFLLQSLADLLEG